MKKLSIACGIVLCLLFNSAAPAQTVAVSDVFAKIRKEGMENSRAMRTVHFFTDVYGPRLTASPNLLAAGNWAVAEMKSWGFDNAYLEPWEFDAPGWVNERAAGFITAPVQDSLVFEVVAWTPGTNKLVKGKAVKLVIPRKPAPTPQNPNATQPPSQTELDAYFANIRPQIKGNMILIGNPAEVPVNFNPPNKRISDQDAERRYGANQPQMPPQVRPTPPQPAPGVLTNRQIAEQLDKFLLENKAAVRIDDAGREHGQIRAFDSDDRVVAKYVPTVVMRNEDFGRISRLIDGGQTVNLEFDIRNRILPGTKNDQGKTIYLSYNTIGEITGSDKKDEVIMLGGHLDSWHAATGATDNATGCAVMMEAARILKAIGVKPRRTIRVALWSGEEQGLLGSQAYVQKHFGSFEKPLPGYEKFGGYFNIDSGTGKARGMSIFGPPETATELREVLKPYAEFGFAGVITTKGRNLGGSDHTSFNNAGLPGIGVGQDPIEYFTHTWHTNLDTYERVIEDDLKKSAIIIASAVYYLSMRDELLPRFAPDQMPKKPE